MTLYQKIIAVFGIIRDLIGLKASKSDVADKFVDGRRYKEGNLVVHDNKVYICTSDYSGSWNSDHFTESNVDAAIKRKVDSDMFSMFDDITVGDAATQKEVRIAVQSILQKLKSISTCLVVFSALNAFGLSRTNLWEDVPPTTTIGQLLDLVNIASIPDQITDSTNTIYADGRMVNVTGGQTNFAGTIALKEGTVSRSKTVGDGAMYADYTGGIYLSYNVITALVGTVEGGVSVSFFMTDENGFEFHSDEIDDDMRFVRDTTASAPNYDTGYFISYYNGELEYWSDYFHYSTVTNVEIHSDSDTLALLPLRGEHRILLVDSTLHSKDIARRSYSLGNDEKWFDENLNVYELSVDGQYAYKTNHVGKVALTNDIPSVVSDIAPSLSVGAADSVQHDDIDLGRFGICFDWDYSRGLWGWRIRVPTPYYLQHPETDGFIPTIQQVEAIAQGHTYSSKRYAMFIIPVNDQVATNTYLNIELKASTNNFSASVSANDRLVYYCHTSITNGPNMDDFMLFVENQTSGGTDGRSYVRVNSSFDLNMQPVTRYVMIVSTNVCRRTDGLWLREDNDDLLWTFARTKLTSQEREDVGGWVWRPIAPVKWFGTLPKWAQQEPR